MGLTMTVQAAIDTADLEAMRRALEESPSAANEVIRWGPGGKNVTHPLHYICDKFCDRTLTANIAVAMVDVLLGSGSNVNGLPENNETPLHGAASLGAEEVGIRLVEAGANVQAVGSFAGETPLHWAAHEGLDRLVERLIAAGADLNALDNMWNVTALGWAEHGLKERKPGHPGRHEKVIEILHAAAT